MLTLGNVQSNIGIQNVAGCVPTSPQYIALANDTCDRLLKRGDWSQTLIPLRVLVSKGCVTWPRQVGQIRKMNSCRHGVSIENIWYEFMDNLNRHHWGGWLGGERTMTAQAKACTYNDIYGPGCQLQLHIRAQSDIGATLQVFGIDNNGQPLQTQNPDNSWSDGIIITAGIPDVRTTGFITRIDRVIKSVTQQPLNLYAWDTINNQLWDLAQYEPSETNPSYLRYQLKGGFNYYNGTGTCPNQESVVALVKIKYIPASAPSDMLAIDNMGAMKFGFMALKCEDAKDLAGAGQNWLAAVAELNAQVQDDNPEWQTPIDIGPFRSRHMGRQSCF